MQQIKFTTKAEMIRNHIKIQANGLLESLLLKIFEPKLESESVKRDYNSDNVEILLTLPLYTPFLHQIIKEFEKKVKEKFEEGFVGIETDFSLVETELNLIKVLITKKCFDKFHNLDDFASLSFEQEKF